MRTYEVAGLPISVDSFDSCVDAVVAAAGTGVAVHFVNAYTIALADSDPAYAQLLSRGLNFTDGTPLAWVGRRAYELDAQAWPRVYGPDVMQAVLERGDGRHYLLGGDEQTLRDLQAAIARRWPQAQMVGAQSPPFRELSASELAAQDQRIADSGAQFVWVGLGTPKQDWEADRLARSLPVVALAVGAAFDFIAGTKPQAPVWMQRSGTEWVYRLASEPRRLAKRYLWGNPRFLLAASRDPGFKRGAGLR